MAFTEQAVGDARARSLEAHKAVALELDTRGDLNASIQEWRIVEALAPGSREPAERIRRLERQIQERVHDELSAAEKDLARGRDKRARHHLLNALALDPDNDTARALLRASEAKRVLARLPTSPTPPSEAVGDPDLGGYHEGPLSEEGATPLAPPGGGYSTYRSQGELEKALEDLLKARAQRGGPDEAIDERIEETKAALAERYYQQGVQLFRTDLSASIQAFDRALAYDPGHEKAKLYRSTALKLLKKQP